jgi:hypothetical protein
MESTDLSIRLVLLLLKADLLDVEERDFKIWLRFKSSEQ